MQLIPRLSELNVSRKRSSKSSRQKSRSNNKVSYEPLEPKNLLATIAWSSGIISETTDISTNGDLAFAINGSGASSVV